MGKIPFLKMHGLGNDFVVLDGRRVAIAVDAASACALANRRTGIGCDQVILLEPPRHPTAQVTMRIRNPDGGEVEACGNATRCVAALLHRETGDTRMRIETIAGLLDAKVLPDGCVAVDMGPARTGWREIPLARAMPTDRVDLAALGPILEHDPLCPERANIGVAAVGERGDIRLRVWERGAGITRACGSGACAALVAAHRRGLTGRHAMVALDGGDLDIRWRDDGHVMMTGPATLAFEGSFDAALLAG